MFSLFLYGVHMYMHKMHQQAVTCGVWTHESNCFILTKELAILRFGTLKIWILQEVSPEAFGT